MRRYAIIRFFGDVNYENVNITRRVTIVLFTRIVRESWGEGESCDTFSVRIVTNGIRIHLVMYDTRSDFRNSFRRDEKCV